jgi:long-subunit acyl-CoA synthetase (AMP-forming)
MSNEVDEVISAIYRSAYVELRLITRCIKTPFPLTTMNSANDWIEFWYQHLPAGARVVIEEHNGKKVSGDQIWRASAVLLAKLRKKGCSNGTVVTTTNSGVRLLRDLLATALCGAILKPGTPRPVGREFQMEEHPALLIQQDSVTGPAIHNDPGYPPDTVLLLYTSGSSTGRPSLIPLTGRGLIAQLVNHGAVFSNDWERTRLSILPQHHAFGLILDLLLGVYLRQRVLLGSNELSRSPNELLRTISEKRVQVVALVPRVLELLERKLRQQPPSLGIMADLHIHTGGAPVRPQLQQELTGKIRKLTIGYGLTEAGPGVMIDGVPIGCEVKVVEQTSEALVTPKTTPPPHDGILWVRGPSLSPALATDSEGYYCTNDLAVCHDQGIEVIGRAGPAIKDANGRWVSLSCLEHELLKFTDVMGAKVYADAATLKVIILTNRISQAQPELCQIIEQALEKRMTRATQVHCHPFTSEKEAELAASNSKGFEALLILPEGLKLPLICE